jgi:TPR repeat protein
MSEAGQFLFDPTALFSSIDPYIIFYAGLLFFVALFIRKYGLQPLTPSNQTGNYWIGLVITSILSIIAVLVIQEIAIYYATVVLSVAPSTVLRTGIYAIRDFHGESEFFPIAIAIMLFLIGGGYAYSDFDVSLPVHIFTFIVSVGVVEEMSKAFAGVALCLFMFSLPLRLGRGAIISAFGIAGLGFGIGEAFHYYAIYQQGGAGLDAYLIRCLWCVPLHFCWTIITGSRVANHLSEVFANNNTKFRQLFWILFGAAIPSIVLHGLYDAFCTHDIPYSWCVGLVSIGWAFIELKRRGNQHTNVGETTTSLQSAHSLKTFDNEITRPSVSEDATAKNNIGLSHANRQGVEKDMQEAVQWLRKAAEQNDPEAQIKLGYNYANGLGVVKDEAEAAKWFRKAAEQNIADAQFNLGLCYVNGQGVEKDMQQAVNWFRKAAEQNNADAQYYIGYAYENGDGVEKDLQEAAKWYRKAAEQNDPEAQSKLGCIYANGLGVEKDTQQAVNWFRKAAEQNDPEAQYNLGYSYANGLGVRKDWVEAVRWFRKATEQNIAYAQDFLGSCYANGFGVDKNWAEATKWYRKAAEQNCPDGQYNLGLCYVNGQGVEKDMQQAVNWFRKAAESDHLEAQFGLGELFFGGLGVQQDYVEAMMWYNKAAEGGFGEAQYKLGCIYANGGEKGSKTESTPKVGEGEKKPVKINKSLFAELKEGFKEGYNEARSEKSEERGSRSLGVKQHSMVGVNYDLVTAYKWMRISALRKYEDSVQLIESLSALMTDEQIAEGKQRADDWIEHHKMP